jgi:hypothetical protein
MILGHFLLSKIPQTPILLNCTTRRVSIPELKKIVMILVVAVMTVTCITTIGIDVV